MAKVTRAFSFTYAEVRVGDSASQIRREPSDQNRMTWRDVALQHFGSTVFGLWLLLMAIAPANYIPTDLCAHHLLFAASRLIGFSNEKEEMMEEKDTSLGSACRVPSVDSGPGSVVRGAAQPMNLVRLTPTVGEVCASKVSNAASTQP